MMTDRYLHECLMVVPKSGNVYWRIRPEHHFKDGKQCKAWNQRHAGFRAGWEQKGNRLKVRIGGHKYSLRTIIKQLQADA